MRLLLTALSMCLLCTGTAAAQGDPYGFHRPGPDATRQAYFAEVRTETNQLLIRWQEAWNHGNAGELARLYAPAATYWPPEAGRTETRDAIRERFTGMLVHAGSVEMRFTDFGTSGDLAYVTVRSVYSSGGRPPTRCTEMLLLHRRPDNGWEIQMHMSRSEPAPPVAE